METLTRGWRKLQWELGEWDLWCMWDFSEESKVYKKDLSENLKGEYCERLKG